ncbi:histone-like transcription factor and archaeal histone protein (macronuclear) [Tetrahymena thermophila SB210]|uniref:Histone-like transcription factor and archaeal histone protein n=1 Tax=Tetrahymena thermophila (strain SB210) TaxID=312017 RepID=I7MHX5_TETTS|nr:histone-like transcription factor and archaeal histone protein [Tetrahymena thermophila SB210]EAS03716.2 histone-like transcription factor and archaeal histone protein [Tetrahymena thermophila SB210]|eukprot:XP_001023961.2 histone-like transcription factor and archaeal histone protein [Tetrahymena thermophila SB210]
MKKKKNQPKFPIARIKKIVQENQDIGKICKTIPYILSRSLELFLEDILQQTVQVCKDYDLNKVQPPALKKAIELSKYNFIEKSLEGVEDLENSKLLKRKKSQSKEQDPLEPKIEKKLKRGRSKKEDNHVGKQDSKKSIPTINIDDDDEDDDDDEYVQEEDEDD